MLGLGRLFSSFRDLYKELNPATLNGAVDVIVVEQPDGSYVCSPFYVRFGKMGVIRSREKLVDITINDESVNLHMKLAESGEAYFVEDTIEEHELPLHLATSPLPFNGGELMADGLANLKRQVQALSDGELPQGASVSVSPNVSPTSSLHLDLVDPEKTPTVENMQQENNDEEIEPIQQDTASKLSNSVPQDRRNFKKLTRLRRENEIFRQRSLHSRSASWHGGGSLPNLLLTTPTSNGPLNCAEQKKKIEPQTASPSFYPASRRFRVSKSFAAQQQLHLDLTEDFDENNVNEAHPQLNSDPQKYANNDSTNVRINCDLPNDVAVSLCGGLDNNVGSSLTEEMFKSKELSFDQFNSNPDLLFSENSVIRWNGKYYKYHVAVPILLSVLVFHRPLSEDVVNDLITKYNIKTVNDKEIVPPKAQQLLDGLHQSGPSSSTPGYSYSSWFSWRRASSMEPSGLPKSSDPKSSMAPNLAEPGASAVSLTSDREDELSIEMSDEMKDVQDLAALSFDDRGAMSDSELDQTFGRPTTSSRYRKSLFLNSDQIKMLKLKPYQANKATFSVTTKYQGTSACECEIYLWRWYDKIVISDIDGTITKSDVLGHIMPIVGRQWEHSSVADLFSRIVDNGYRVMYLTARAIGQSQWTKDYLKSIKQDNKSLPEGPLQLSPTSLFTAFHSEVIEKKPEIFKMKCLRDIKSLFIDSSNPYYAGFGNKATDEYAYRASGVPSNRIFTINPLGEVRFADKDLRSSYQHISDLVDHIFPPLPVLKRVVEDNQSADISTLPDTYTSEEFSSFTYWRQSSSNVEVDVSKFQPEKLHKSTRKESTTTLKKK